MTEGLRARFGDPLTERQVLILRCLADGCWYEKTARELGISERTVRRNLRAAQTKLGAKTVTRAVVLADRSGLLMPLDAVVTR